MIHGPIYIRMFGKIQKKILLGNLPIHLNKTVILIKGRVQVFELVA